MTHFRILTHFMIATMICFSLLLSGCSDDDEITPSDHGAYSITAVNPDSDSFGISYSGDNQVFCYENEGCSTQSGFSSLTMTGEGESTLITSNAERFAVGLSIEINITRGEGYFEVEGFNLDTEDYEITDNEVIYTSDVYSEGDTFTYIWGDTEGFDDGD